MTGKRYLKMLGLFRRKLSPVVQVSQPFVWIYQPPRSGGSMLLRLFACHPELHVHPEPMNIRWTHRPERERLKVKFSMARFAEDGFIKKSSNRPQPHVPIEFDTALYDEIFETYSNRTPQEAYQTANTARFNAWKNYRNLEGNRKFVALHSTVWAKRPVERSVTNFFHCFPDGRIIFTARKPDDWLASAVHLKDEPRLNELNSAISEYVGAYRAFLEASRGAPNDKILVLHFDDVVSSPESELPRICRFMGISFHANMETTTINGVPTEANSSHSGGASTRPDRSVLGRGAEIRDVARRNPDFAEAEKLFDSVRALA